MQPFKEVEQMNPKLCECRQPMNFIKIYHGKLVWKCPDCGHDEVEDSQIFKEVKEMGFPIYAYSKECIDNLARFISPCSHCKHPVGCRSIKRLQKMIERIMTMEKLNIVDERGGNELISLACKRVKIVGWKETLKEDFFLVTFEDKEERIYYPSNLIEIEHDPKLVVDVHLVKYEETK